MIAVIQAHAHDLSDLAHARAEAGTALDSRQFVGRERTQASKALGQQGWAGEVAHHRREIADRAARIENTRLLAARGAEAYELHGRPHQSCVFFFAITHRYERDCYSKKCDFYATVPDLPSLDKLCKLLANGKAQGRDRGAHLACRSEPARAALRGQDLAGAAACATRNAVGLARGCRRAVVQR